MRETGYYWVKTGYDGDNWEVALFDEYGCWTITGDDQLWFPEEINETRIKSPGEKQHVDITIQTHSETGASYKAEKGDIGNFNPNDK